MIARDTVGARAGGSSGTRGRLVAKYSGRSSLRHRLAFEIRDQLTHVGTHSAQPVLRLQRRCVDEDHSTPQQTERMLTSPSLARCLRPSRCRSCARPLGGIWWPKSGGASRTVAGVSPDASAERPRSQGAPRAAAGLRTRRLGSRGGAQAARHRASAQRRRHPAPRRSAGEPTAPPRARSRDRSARAPPAATRRERPR